MDLNTALAWLISNESKKQKQIVIELAIGWAFFRVYSDLLVERSWGYVWEPFSLKKFVELLSGYLLHGWEITVISFDRRFFRSKP